MRDFEANFDAKVFGRNSILNSFNYSGKKSICLENILLILKTFQNVIHQFTALVINFSKLQKSSSRNRIRNLKPVVFCNPFICYLVDGWGTNAELVISSGEISEVDQHGNIIQGTAQNAQSAGSLNLITVGQLYESAEGQSVEALG